MNQCRLVLLALGAGLSGHSALLRAQTPAAGLRRVDVLAPSTRVKEDVILKPFFDRMRELGWIEGQTIAYDRAPCRRPAARPATASGLCCSALTS